MNAADNIRAAARSAGRSTASPRSKYQGHNAPEVQRRITAMARTRAVRPTPVTVRWATPEERAQWNERRAAHEAHERGEPHVSEHEGHEEATSTSGTSPPPDPDRLKVSAP